MFSYCCCKKQNLCMQNRFSVFLSKIFIQQFFACYQILTAYLNITHFSRLPNFNRLQKIQATSFALNYKKQSRKTHKSPFPRQLSSKNFARLCTTLRSIPIFNQFSSRKHDYLINFPGALKKKIGSALISLCVLILFDSRLLLFN
jgi:hypothetical protein